MIFSKIFNRILRSVSDDPPQILPLIFSAGFLALIFSSCSSTKTIPFETIHHDTLYTNKEKYDSIYVYQDKYVNRSKDTVLIKEIQLQYKYKLLRDTIRIVQRDSIPYEVRITETVEVERPPTLYDRICKATFWLLLFTIAIYTYLKLKKH